MTDIQAARDVITKWRDKAAPGPWEVNEPIGRLNRHLDWVSIDTADEVEDPRNVTYEIPRWEAPLIIGTAGNPELLDAIDELLALYVTYPGEWPTPTVKRIAAAIIAADERMNS